MIRVPVPMKRTQDSDRLGYSDYVNRRVRIVLWKNPRQNPDNERPKEEPTMSLHEAVRSNNLKMAKLLLKQKADVNKRDECELMPLHLAVNNKSYKMVELLLKHGALVNPKRLSPESKAPLFLAAEQNSIEIARLLLNNGALVRKAMTSSNTAYKIAIKHHNVPLANLLFESELKQIGVSGYRIKKNPKWSKTEVTEEVKKIDSPPKKTVLVIRKGRKAGEKRTLYKISA